MEKEGERIKIEEYIDHLITSKIITEGDVTDIDEKNKNIIVDGYIFLVEEEPNGNIKITYQSEADGKPRIAKIKVVEVETDSIKIKVIASQVNGGSFSYAIKNITEGETDYQVKAINIAENEYRFEGLTLENDYRIQVKVENSKGSDTKETEEKINTKPIEVSSISLDNTELTLEEDDMATLTATILPSNAKDKTITWTSSNEEVATVDSEGRVTAMAQGSAIITAKANGGTNVKETATITVTPFEASYDHPFKVRGFAHTEGTWNNGYTIKGVTENVNDEFVWVPCVTEQSKVKDGDTVVNYEKITTGKYNEGKFTLSPFSSSVRAEDDSVQEVYNSVEKYGGFYIAKYEAGTLVPSNDADRKTKPLSQPSLEPWHFITRNDAIIVSKLMINPETTGSKSTLVTGEAWDTTLQWMVNTSDNKNQEPNRGYDVNSTNKGLYGGTNALNYSKTGFFQVNNIYDMAGNLFEWTTENTYFYNYHRMIVRGGGNLTGGTDFPACARHYGEKDGFGYKAGGYTTFRVIIYK